MTPEELIDRQLKFYNNNDLEGFCSTYSEDIQIVNHSDGSIILSGMDALREKYTQRFEVQKVHAEIVNRMVLGNTVIDYENVTGIVDGQIVKAIAVYEVQCDLIIKVSFISQ